MHLCMACVFTELIGACGCGHLQLSVCMSVVEKELLETLPFSEQCSADEAELIRFCYENILNKVKLCRKHSQRILAVLVLVVNHCSRF